MAHLIELAKLSKPINRFKTNDVCAYNTADIEETLKIGGSLKVTKRKQAIGKDRMYALRDEQGKIKDNMDEIIKAAERFYTRLCHDVIPGDTAEGTRLTCE